MPGKSDRQKEAEKVSLDQQKQSLEAQKQALKIFQEDVKLRKTIFDTIEPLAKAMISMGLDPQAILASPLGISLLTPARSAVSKEFEQARQNLIGSFAGSGVSPGAGVAAGPLANLFGQEAAQQASLVQQLPLQALQLGLQGANVLQGQQAVFNPSITGNVAAQQGGVSTQAGQNVIFAPDPFADFLTTAVGSALSGLPALFPGKGP